MVALDARAVTEVDREIGIHIRSRRTELGFSQAYVADAVGITFQQLQKYEVGQNRVAVAMLLRLAEVLQVEPSDMLPLKRKPGIRKPSVRHDGEDAMAVQLQNLFSQIESVRGRRLVLELARNLRTGAPPKKSKSSRVAKKR